MGQVQSGCFSGASECASYISLVDEPRRREDLGKLCVEAALTALLQCLCRLLRVGAQRLNLARRKGVTRVVGRQRRALGIGASDPSAQSLSAHLTRNLDDRPTEQ
eukprot:scaffold9712_cov32-Tisochrysis_lutea.AAC.2